MAIIVGPSSDAIHFGMTDVRLFLVAANKSRTSGQPWSDDDYDVHDGTAAAQVVGRIYCARHGAGDQWFWTITTTPSSAANNGYAGTREAAMATLKTRWVMLRDGE